MNATDNTKGCWTVIGGLATLVISYILALSWLSGDGKPLPWWAFIAALPLGLLVYDWFFNGWGITIALLSTIFTLFWGLLIVIGLPAGMLALGVFLHVRGLGGWAFLLGIVYLVIAVFLGFMRDNYSPWDVAERTPYALCLFNSRAGYLVGAGLVLSALVVWIL